MSVRKRDARYQKRWVATVDHGRDPFGKRIREERSFETRREAIDWDAEEHARARAGRRLRRDLPTTGQLLADWLTQGEHVRAWSPRHLANTRRVVDVILSRVAQIRIDELTTSTVQMLLTDELATGTSAHTIRQARNALRAAFNMAQRRQLIEINPAALVEIPSTRRKPPVTIPQEQIIDFIEVLGIERLAPFWTLSMLLALRPAEAAGLRWPDVDFEAERVTIVQTIQYSGGAYHVRPTKTGHRRSLPLPGAAARVLRSQQLNQQWEKGDALEWDLRAEFADLVFTNQTGGPVHTPQARRRLQTLIGSANERRRRDGLPEFPDITLYQLRHTGATLLRSLGANLDEIQQLMGHSTLQMTRQYADITEALQRQAMARLDAFLNPDGGTDGGTAD